MSGSYQFAIHIGFPKCASSYMQSKIFNLHPEINYLGPFGYYNPDNYDSEDKKDNYLPISKEIWSEICLTPEDQYNAAKLKEKFDTKFQPYFDPEKINVFAQEKLCMGDWKQKVSRKMVAERLKALFGPSKIILCVRDPVDMMESIYFNMTGGFSEKKKFISFAEWFETQKNLPAEQNYFRRIMMQQVIEIYEDIFGGENILVLQFETLKKDNDAFMKQISAFLDIPTFNDLQIEITKKAANERIDQSHILFHKLGKFVPYSLLKWFLSVMPENLKKAIKALIGGNQKPRLAMTDADRAHIYGVYKRENPDIGKWGVRY